MPSKTDRHCPLLKRITAGRALHEHHVWEALRWLDADDDRRAGNDGRLLQLMHAQALVEAVIHLSACRQCRVESIRHDGTCWRCVMRQVSDGPTAARRARSAHADLAVALLQSLIRLHGLPAGQKERG